MVAQTNDYDREKLKNFTKAIYTICKENKQSWEQKNQHEKEKLTTEKCVCV